MYVSIVPETILSKVTNTIVPCSMGAKGALAINKSDLTETGQEHTTLVFTLNLYVEAINAQKVKFSTKDFFSKCDQICRIILFDAK